MNITQARGLYTSKLVAVYQERPPMSSFLRSLFKTVTAPTKYVSIEVERMGEPVAIDVVRGTEGNRNTFSLSTDKSFFPPYFREFFDATELEIYDRVLGSQGTDNSDLFVALLNSVADRMGSLVNKIERSKELMCAQVLETGIVTLVNGDDINYKRKTASIVDAGAGNYFANNVDPFAQFEAGCKFLREVGMSGDGTFNAIVGGDALTDLLANTKFLARQNTFNMALDAVQGPVRDNNTGATFHGTITAGSYKVQLWAYTGVYKHPTTGVITPYVNPKLVTLLPLAPKFIMAHAAVPQLVGEPGQMPKQGEYVFQDFIDGRLATHEHHVLSAPLPIPVAVDQIYTFRGKAA